MAANYENTNDFAAAMALQIWSRDPANPGNHGNQGSPAGLVGAVNANTYPIFGYIQPINPHIIPHPTMEQQQMIVKAVEMLSNHQLLMKFATENKQVTLTKL